MTQINSPNPDATSINEPGHLLLDLERRQDDVLAQLDELDNKLKEVLKGLGATLDGEEECESVPIPRAAA